MIKYKSKTNYPYPKGTIIEIDYRTYPIAILPDGTKKEVRVMSEKYFQNKNFEKL